MPVYAPFARRQLLLTCCTAITSTIMMHQCDAGKAVWVKTSLDIGLACMLDGE